LWPRPVVTPPIGSRSWRCASWEKTACPPGPPAGTYGAITACLCPLPRSKTGSRLGGKKAQGQMGSTFLDWALETFSGSVAVDELYEGPYGVLSAGDHRQDKRILSEVLDHDPCHDATDAFLGRLKAALEARNWALTGSTTDGSALYPEPIRTVFGAVPHQLCTFHVIKELTKGILRAVASERQRLATSKPKVKRGRPSSKDKAARRLARTSTSIQETISDLFQDRFLFVTRHLTRSGRKRLLHITRGLPHRRKLREIMEHI